MQRFRLVYAKGEELMYTGNLDMMRVWERTFRRAGLNLAYSQGFHPQPKMHQACPLPLGFTSENELMDFWLDSAEEISQVKEKMRDKLQPGITITSLRKVALEEKPLQTLVTAAKYLVILDETIGAPVIEEELSALNHKETCVRTRRGKQYDLLPLITSITLVNETPLSLEMTLTATPGATGRPEEVLDELGIDFSETSIIRTGLVLSE